jgi:hypothetical protein
VNKIVGSVSPNSLIEILVQNSSVLNTMTDPTDRIDKLWHEDFFYNFKMMKRVVREAVFMMK